MLGLVNEYQGGLGIFSLDPEITKLGRIVFTSFLITFILVRLLVLSMAAGKLKNRFLNLGGTHIHHLNYGIFLLAAVGAYLIFWKPGDDGLSLAAGVYGVGTALTFDEFGMWLHLEDNYWQRASWDAVALVASMFALVAFAPSIYDLRVHHYMIITVMFLGLGAYLYMLMLLLRRG